MQIISQKGAHNTVKREENRRRVWDYYAVNRAAKQSDVAKALGLSLGTVHKAVTAIRNGWKPAGDE